MILDTDQPPIFWAGKLVGKVAVMADKVNILFNHKWLFFL